MHKFIIVYENGPSIENGREILIKEIMSFDGWAQTAQNIWIIKTELSRDEVWARLSNCINNKDMLFIGPLSAGSRWVRVKNPDNMRTLFGLPPKVTKN